MKKLLYLPLLLILLVSWVSGVFPAGSGVAYASPAVPVYRTFSEAGGEGISILVDQPSGTVDGDLLVAGMTTDGVTTLTEPTGWTEINQGSSGGKVTSGSWWKIASSEPVNYTFQASESEPIYIFILRIDGQHATTPIDVSAFTIGDSTTPTCPSVTTNAGECLILRLFGADENDITINGGYPTAHIGITVNRSAEGNSQCSGGAAYTTQALEGATGTASFTILDTEEWYTTTIAIKPPPLPSISNSPGSFDFETVAASSTPNTGMGHFTITNSSNVTIDINIKCNDWTHTAGSNDWIYGASAENTARLKASNDQGGTGGSTGPGDYDIIVPSGETGTLFCDDVATATTEINWELQLEAPSGFTHSDPQITTVTLTATAA